MNLSQWPLTRIQRKFNIDHAITYRIAVGPQQGRKVFLLRRCPAMKTVRAALRRAAKEAGFSLHAGVTADAHERDKLEWPCSCISRSAVSEKRLGLIPNGNVSSG